MKLHKTEYIIVINDGGKTVERRVYINDLGELFAKYDGAVRRVDYFEGCSTLYHVDYRGRRTANG